MFFNIQTAKLFVVATSALLVPVAAQAATADADTVAFEHDGLSYAYKTAQVNGRTVINGKDGAGKSFRLIVGERRVYGNYNGTPIDIALRDVKRGVEAVAMR